MVESNPNQTTETERKWLVSSLPDLSNSPGKKLLQGYIVVTPDTEVRLRSIDGSQFFQTVKTGDGMVRGEREINLTPEQFDILWPTTGGRIIEKIRYSIVNVEGSGLVAELDMYGGKLTGLHTVEVEFPDIETAQQFKVPTWFGREVTLDSEYKNKNLALKGLPEEKHG